MTQPAQSSGGIRGVLTRRIGPAPAWVWFIIFVIGLAVFLHWRASRKASAVNSSNVTASPNLTTAPSTLIPYSNQTFVNVQRSEGPPVGQTPPPGSMNPTPIYPAPGTPDRTRPAPNPPPVGGFITSIPPQRTTSITYPVASGDNLTMIARQYGITSDALYNANSSTIEATARQHGFSSANGPDGSKGWWIWPGEQLVIPT